MRGGLTGRVGTHAALSEEAHIFCISGDMKGATTSGSPVGPRRYSSPRNFSGETSNIELGPPMEFSNFAQSTFSSVAAAVGSGGAAAVTSSTPAPVRRGEVGFIGSLVGLVGGDGDAVAAAAVLLSGASAGRTDFAHAPLAAAAAARCLAAFWVERERRAIVAGVVGEVLLRLLPAGVVGVDIA